MLKPGKKFSFFPSCRALSISRSLTIALILAVVGVSVVAVSLFYFSLSRKASIQLAGKADEYIDSLGGVLEMPLWDLDARSVQRTGEAFAQNELVEVLKISDNIGHVYFDLNRASGSPLISRTRKILRAGRRVGSVDIALTSRYATEANRRFLIFCLGTVSLVIVVLASITELLLRTLLNKPLDHLGEIVNAYGSGRYAATGYDMPFIEFQPLVNVLHKMGDEISSRIQDLQEAEKKYRGIFEKAVEGIFQFVPDGHFLSANPSMARILGYDSPAELMDRIADIGGQLFVDPGQCREFLRTMAKGEVTHAFQVQFYRKDGSQVWVSLHAHPHLDDNGTLLLIEGLLEDISEHKRAEAERIKLEDKLRQSQKMETVGLLAGGIAHDFNNLLTPIMGYTEMLTAELPADDLRRQKLGQVSLAAERARDLVSQLLSFSRKQIIELKKVSFGMMLNQFEDMLRRTIRENVRIEVTLSPVLGLIKADQGQIEQVLINLAINAQDAMPDGGTMTIEAADVDLDESYTATHPEIPPGSYVMLAISDTGVGMDKETMEHIFDPFFTTKELGKGTGLGLSTVYGIVKQHGGSISVYSEKEHGSTFKVFLPRIVDQDMTIDTTDLTLDKLVFGTETVMLVEDNAIVRNLACTILENLGYRVLVAEGPDRCLELIARHQGPIDLLLTDVVMPGMNGRDLFERLSPALPELKVLFMSGYTTNVIMHHGVLDEGVHFLQKPFSMLSLSQKIRNVLAS